MWQKIKHHIPIIIFLIFFFLFFGYKIIVYQTPFYDWDESLYVQSGIEMIKNKYYLFPMWQQEPWLDKPPIPSLVYGLFANYKFIAAEISTRLFALILSLINVLFMYIIYNKVFKNALTSTLSAVAYALSPLFLQRAQTVNADIFLLFSWSGYILFRNNFFISLLFLLIGTLSKSLLGFYPIIICAIYELYLFFTIKRNKKDLLNTLKKLVFQSTIALFWFISMYVIYKESFLKQHIIESHFRRVTSSIEFHFGQKTFYLDMIKQQFEIFSILIVLGIGIYIWKLIKEKQYKETLLYANYLLPWYIFLNLTKTKIFWYLYSALPQFGFFLAMIPASIKNTKYKNSVALLLIGIIIFYSFYISKIPFTTYSKQESYIRLALKAKTKCTSLIQYPDQKTRKSYQELDSMGLTITTTRWWGNHPSIVYYFGKKVYIIYSEKEFKTSLNTKLSSCVLIEDNDLVLVKNYIHKYSDGTFNLLIRSL